MTERPAPRPIDERALLADALGLRDSRFAADAARSDAAIRAAVGGARVLVVGGAGTIGSATTHLLADLAPACLHVLDQSENYLAELVRDLRGRPGGLRVDDFRALPLDYGSPVTGRLLREAARYDCVLNFAALKHVRSEKDAVSLLQMLDTNIVRHLRFKQWLEAHGHATNYFAVSTDKAANPTSLMGASKRLMEDIAFDFAASQHQRVTSARFANVAFSNGSLLDGFLRRVARRQPFAVPRGTRRYFVSPAESGHICLLAAFAVPGGHVGFPRLDPGTNLVLLEDVAVRVLGALGFDAEWFDDESEARRSLESLAPAGRWPVLLTPLDTSGEKEFEEFVGQGETAVEVGLAGLRAIRHEGARFDAKQALVAWLDGLIARPEVPVDKAEIARRMEAVIPTLHHRETGRSLDERF